MENRNIYKGFAQFHRYYEDKIASGFEKYGSFVSRYPVSILVTCILVNLLLGIGIVNLETERDLALLYEPKGNEASKDRIFVGSLYKDKSGSEFYPHSVTNYTGYCEIIIRMRDESNIINRGAIDEVKRINDYVQNNISFFDIDVEYFYKNVCALQNQNCMTHGEIELLNIIPTYTENSTNIFRGQINMLHRVFGGMASSKGVLTSAKSVRLIYYLRQQTKVQKDMAMQFEKTFLSAIQLVQTNITELAYSSTYSIDNELNRNTNEGIIYFIFTFLLMIIYSSVATSGGNCVSDRQHLGKAGVLAALLAIFGSMGFTATIGIRYVSVLGVMPFLILGIGIDDMFILMSGFADCPASAAIEDKMKQTMKTSGIAITITSFTDILAFAIGAMSPFESVNIFCLSTGAAVLFCYFNQLGFLLPCMVINERRILQNRHALTCQIIPSRQITKEKLQAERKLDRDNCSSDPKRTGGTFRSRLTLMCCTGDPPVVNRENESILEKYPKMLFKRIVSYDCTKALVILLFIVYLTAALWGALHVRQGINLKNLVTEDSYFYKYTEWFDQYYDEEISIMFVINSNLNYSDNDTQSKIDTMLSNALSDRGIHRTFTINWLRDYKNSAYYCAHNETAFKHGLEDFMSLRPDLQNDVIFDEIGNTIRSSRFYVLTKHLESTTAKGDIMLRMRDIARTSGLPCIAYSPAFIAYEQYVLIFANTLHTAAVALATMFVVTALFMPHILTLILVFLTMVMVLVGVYGFMYFVDLSLNFMTMIYLIMSIGFSVDYSAHICHAYVVGTETSRQERVNGAIDRSGGPIFNASLSSVIGVAMLMLSSSYIFQTFCKIMLLVLIFGLAHSILLLPVILSMVGPQPGYRKKGAKDQNSPCYKVTNCNDDSVHPVNNAAYVKTDGHLFEKSHKDYLCSEDNFPDYAFVDENSNV